MSRTFCPRVTVQRLVFSAVLTIAALGCQPELPEPQSPAAQLYQQRCSSCHRLYGPQLLTAEMWRVIVSRMEQEFQRRGLPPLSAEDKQMILAYLAKHGNGK